MIRFQADADLNQVIVAALIRRDARIDFQSASAAALAGLDDSAVLRVAAREGRVLVAEVVSQLLLIANATSSEDWVDRICYLPL